MLRTTTAFWQQGSNPGEHICAHTSEEATIRCCSSTGQVTSACDMLQRPIKAACCVSPQHMPAWKDAILHDGSVVHEEPSSDPLGASWSQARDHCASRQMQLCSRVHLHEKLNSKTICSQDSLLAWTAEPCSGATQSSIPRDGLGAFTDNERADLSMQVERARGIYVRRGSSANISTNDRAQAKRAVLVTLSNAPYSRILDNWLCHVTALELKALVVAVDANTSHFLQSNQLRYPHTFVVPLKSHTRVQTGDRDGNGAARFFSRSFYQISNAKLNVVLAILQLGVDAWFSDPDVVFLRDPWPTFRLHLACDYEFAIESSNYDPRKHHTRATLGGGAQANTGFHKFRSSPRAIAFLTEVVKLTRMGYGADDQTNLWWLLTQPRWMNLSHYSAPATDISYGLEAKAVSDANVRGLFTFCSLRRAVHLACWVGHGPFHRWLPKPLPATYHANCIQGIALKETILRKYLLWSSPL